MFEQVEKNIYRVEIPLKGNPLKALYSYFIKGDDKWIIIDTGFNSEECKIHLMDAIQALDVDIKKLEVVITHLHSDHCGLAFYLQSLGAKVFASKVDGEIINDMSTDKYWNKFREYEKLFGLDVDNTSFNLHPGYKYRPRDFCDFNYLSQGDIISCGEYTLEVIETPGHTPGLIGLIEREKKLYFSSDHILGKITPNIAFWGEGRNDLSIYLKSLDKVYDLDINKVYTPHRHIVYNMKQRIDELRAHHGERLDEIREVMGEDVLSPRDVASRMKWSLTIKEWSDFPDPQKWFATSEAMSHLEYLYYAKELNRATVDGRLIYSKISK